MIAHVDSVVHNPESPDEINFFREPPLYVSWGGKINLTGVHNYVYSTNIYYIFPKQSGPISRSGLSKDEVVYQKTHRFLIVAIGEDPDSRIIIIPLKFNA